MSGLDFSGVACEFSTSLPFIAFFGYPGAGEAVLAALNRLYAISVIIIHCDKTRSRAPAINVSLRRHQGRKAN